MHLLKLGSLTLLNNSWQSESWCHAYMTLVMIKTVYYVSLRLTVIYHYCSSTVVPNLEVGTFQRSQDKYKGSWDDIFSVFCLVKDSFVTLEIIPTSSNCQHCKLTAEVSECSDIKRNNFNGARNTNSEMILSFKQIPVSTKLIWIY